MMHSRWRPWLFGAALAVTAFGCYWRSWPIPPPTADRVQADTCAPPLCPAGGVVVTLVGRATPGALVVVENATRHHADGRRYVASGWASDRAVATDGGVGDAAVDGGVNTGPEAQFIVVLRAENDPDGTVTISQLGDDLSVVQFVRDDQGLWQQSTASHVTVR